MSKRGVPMCFFFFFLWRAFLMPPSWRVLACKLRSRTKFSHKMQVELQNYNCNLREIIKEMLSKHKYKKRFRGGTSTKYFFAYIPGPSS